MDDFFNELNDLDRKAERQGKTGVYGFRSIEDFHREFGPFPNGNIVGEQ